MSYIFHQLVLLNFRKNHNFFKKNLNNCKEIQLKKINHNYQKFIEENSLTTYADYESYCLDLKKSGQRCVPTSGSTSKIKWIPYTTDFTNELSMATHPWLYDVYKEYPLIKNGKHFWSMSWMPKDLRESQTSDDLSYFSFIERAIMKRIMAINENVAHLPTVESSMIKSLQLLIDGDVSLISVWSPTFLLEMLEMIIGHKQELLKNITNIDKRKIIEFATKIDEELMLKLFPKLVLISAWDTSTSIYFADRLKTLFPHVHFQGKGLFATEGVVTIPFENKYLLAYCSHFYEFECVKTKKIFPSFEVELGLKAKVIITTANGFARYQLNDIVEVTGFCQTVPIIKFIGREKEVDMVGEKLNHNIFNELIEKVNVELGVKIYSFLGVMRPEPHYVVIVEKKNDENNILDQKRIIDFIDSELSKHFHYRLAREANQLKAIELLITANPIELYQSKLQDNIQIKGNLKIEPVIILKE